ncbi:MAG: TonB-dependent receptor [Bacteroidota bacterium]|nr:TonB-dependent receptor [Bacteroidota bacterium]
MDDFFFVAVLLFFFSSLLFAQNNSTLRGKVVSAEDSSPLVGATVTVNNTSLGASTDADGIFRIKNIPAGMYSLAVSMIGFQRKILEHVRVGSGENHLLTIALSPSPIQANPVVITATKHEQSLEEAPVSMSIVNAHMLEARNTISVDDALRYVPGVNLMQSQVNIRGSSGYSRGVGSRVLLLIDGLPMLTGDTGEITFEAIPVFQIDRIEVVKGAGSALYGSSALGGVINVITKEIPERPITRWRMYAGAYDSPSFSEWKWSSKTRAFNGEFFSHAQRFGGLSLVLSGSRIFDDGYRENDWLRRYDGYAKVKYDFSPFQSLTATTNLFYQYHGDFIWWRNANDALRPDSSQENFSVTSYRTNTSFLFRSFVNDEWYYEVKGIWVTGNWHEDSLAVREANASRSSVADGEIQVSYTPNTQTTWTFGIAGNFDHVISDLFGTHSGFGGALYGQDEIKINDALTTTLGARFDVQQIEGLNSNQQVNPKLGVTYELDPQTHLRASIGRGFRAPSIGELYAATNVSSSSISIVPSTDLRPEHSWTYEVGGTRALLPNLSADVSLFQSDFSGLIEAGVEIDSARNSPVVRFRNVTRARIQGVETNFHSELLDHTLLLDLNYTYNWPYDVGQKAILHFRPRHIASVNATYGYGDVTFGADVRFISRVDAIDENLVQLAPIIDGDTRVPIYVNDVRVVAGLASFGLPLKASFNINNLLRYNYVEIIGNIAPLRNFVLTVEGAL